MATPPLTANPRPAFVPSVNGSEVVIWSNSIPFALNIPITSSKVNTKSISLRIDLRLASNFLAAQGPINTTLAFGFSFLIKRPVNTIGVNAIEIYGAKSGKFFFAITDHAGQQLVAINGCFSGTFSKKSSASSIVHKSAPIATSTTSAKPTAFNAAFTLSGVTAGPN